MHVGRRRGRWAARLRPWTELYRTNTSTKRKRGQALHTYHLMATVPVAARVGSPFGVEIFGAIGPLS